MPSSIPNVESKVRTKPNTHIIRWARSNRRTYSQLTSFRQSFEGSFISTRPTFRISRPLNDYNPFPKQTRGLCFVFSHLFKCGTISSTLIWPSPVNNQPKIIHKQQHGRPSRLSGVRGVRGGSQSRCTQKIVRNLRKRCYKLPLRGPQKATHQKTPTPPSHRVTGD